MKISKVLITPVGMRCNLVCDYCYNEPFYCSGPQNVLAHDTSCHFFYELAQITANRVTVIWHGGEPTILGPQEFEKYLEDEWPLKEMGIEVHNCIQTNATLLSSDWCDLFRRCDVRPSVSIDGPSFLHNQHRRDRRGKPTYERVMSGIELLRVHGVKFGLLIVVTKDSLGHTQDIFDWIVANKITSFDFLPCFESEAIRDGRPHNSPSPEEFAQFLIDFFDLWWKHDDSTIHVRVFHDVLRYFLGAKMTVCSWQGSCSWILSLDECGQLFPCARFHGYPEMSFGQIRHGSLSEILQSSQYIKLRNAMLVGQNECIQCSRLAACGGGCPLARYSLSGDFSASYYFCTTRRRLFDHIESRLAAQQNYFKDS